LHLHSHPLILIAAVASALTVHQHFDANESKQLVPMLQEVIAFPTYAGNDEAHVAQKAWLGRVAADMGFTLRDAGKVTEIELPATVPGAPVLGLIIHGDVQPVDADSWSFPPFSAKVENGYVYGRGSADDKGPLVQTLLAMHALKESGLERTHTIRLLVGSTEESDTAEMGEYLEKHAAPDYSLVLDSNFPVVVGEKAWNALTVTSPLDLRPGTGKPYAVSAMWAGLAASIVPDHAELTLTWTQEGPADWEPLLASLQKVKLPNETRFASKDDFAAKSLRIVAYGHSAHAGVNLEGGRNALVALATMMRGKLPSGGANDLLSFALTAGQDIYGTGLGIRDNDPVWGHYAVNVATIKPDEKDPKQLALTINIRRTPPRTGPQLEFYLQSFVNGFNARSGAHLVATGYYEDEPLGFDPKSKIVKRLLRSYAVATGEKSPKPAISGGGTYAKRLPHAIAFGMWFPDKPYPGHDVDEKNPIADLQKGTHVLIEALVDIATGPKIENAFQR
jgi:succinyl-diaminopimelate desuccinylase